MRLSVREQEVDDHADDGEQEDDETPDELIGDGPVRFQNFDCSYFIFS